MILTGKVEIDYFSQTEFRAKVFIGDLGHYCKTKRRVLLLKIFLKVHSTLLYHLLYQPQEILSQGLNIVSKLRQYISVSLTPLFYGFPISSQYTPPNKIFSKSHFLSSTGITKYPKTYPIIPGAKFKNFHICIANSKVFPFRILMGAADLFGH